MSATPESPSRSSSGGAFSLTSSAFSDGAAIPPEFGCDGANVSPPLAWSGVPPGSAALVLVLDDPDARDFVHWIVLDLPATDGELPRNVSASAEMPQQGTNDFGNVGYGGPCPPSGTHHYEFTLTALSAPLGLGGHPSASAVRNALSAAADKALGTAMLAGTFKRR